MYHPLENRCEDNWTWKHEENCHDVQLTDPERRTALFHPSWSNGTAGVRGTKTLNQGRYYWEIHVNNRVFGTSIMFGIGTEKARLHSDNFMNMLGDNCQSWGLSHIGLLWHDGKFRKYTEPFKECTPTTIGIYFDGINGTLTYYKDGIDLGVAFSNLDKVTEPLYPIICSSACRTEMTLGSTRREFNSMQDCCRAVILKHMSKKEEIHQLELPRTLKIFISEGLTQKS